MSAPVDPRKLVSISEISRALGVARHTARLAVQKGDIPGGFVRYRSARKGGSERWGVWREVFYSWLDKQPAPEEKRRSR